MRKIDTYTIYTSWQSKYKDPYANSIFLDFDLSSYYPCKYKEWYYWLQTEID